MIIRMLNSCNITQNDIYLQRCDTARKHKRNMKLLCKLICCFALLSLPYLGYAQITENENILHGNEWIDFNKSYFKIQLAEDGIYRISRQVLEDAGFPVNEVSMSEISIYHLGKQIPIYTSSESLMGNEDYIEFYGKKNRNELDKWMFSDPQYQLNPKYSLITDTTSYFVTFGDTNAKRYEQVETDLSENTLTPEEYYLEVFEKEYHTNYLRAGNSKAYKSSYDNIIGFGSGYKKTFPQYVPTSQVYLNGPEARLNIRLVTNNTSQALEYTLNNEVLKSIEGEGTLNIDESIAINPESIASSSTISVNSKSSTGKINVSSYRLTYPRLCKFGGIKYKYFELVASENYRYLEIQTNYNTSNLIYDIVNNQIIYPVVENKLAKFIIAPVNEPGRYIYRNINGIKNVTKAQKIEFIDYSSRDNDLIFISNKLIAIDEDETDVIAQYKYYRESPQGGNFTPIVVDIEQLYNQFSYGIHRHPYSVKNFINYVHSKDWDALKYVYILGGAIQSNTSRTKIEQIQKVLIPTYGYPPSDNLLTSLWGEDISAYSTGRIAAQSASELRAYLDKVKNVESNITNPHNIENKEWMKNILHLSGGGINEYAQIRHELRLMEDIIESSSFGGNVTTFYKVNSDPVDNSAAAYISNLIHDGLSIITFFGHSAPGTFDINLEDVDNYNNSPKFPVLLSFGCYSGNIHLGNYTLANDYVLKPNKGMSSFIGSSWNAYVGSLSSYGKNFYKIYGESDSNRRLGDITRDALKLSYSKTFRELLTLHGDPCLGVYSFDAPDYLPDAKTAKVNPEIIDAYNETFEFCTDILNLGKHKDSILEVSIKHFNKEDQLMTDTLFKVKAPNNRINYCFQLPLFGDDVIGLNYIKVEVDPQNLVNELPNPEGELNNSFKNEKGTDIFEFYIIDNSASPVKPKNFSIVPYDTIMFIANTTNAYSDKQDYIMELDTNILFNSPFKKSTVVLQKNGTISWLPEVNWEAEKEYFWRVSPKNLEDNVPKWNHASFVYRPMDQVGFNQSDHDQFLNNEGTNMIATPEGLKFAKNFVDYRIYNRVRKGNDEPHFYVNGSYYQNCYSWSKNPALAVVVIDTLARFSMVNQGSGLYGSENPFGNGGLAFYFDPSDKTSRISLVNFLKDSIADTDYVYFYSKHKFVSDNFHTEDWALDSLENEGHNIFNYLKSQGATKIDYFRDSTIVPYYFIYQKNKGVHAEAIADNIDGSIDGTVSINGRWNNGDLFSPIIGPVKNWSHIEWDFEKANLSKKDSSWLSVYGIKNDGTRVKLIDQTMESYIDLQNIIQADSMPYLQLEYHAEDKVDLSPTNIDYWRVYFEGLPELIVDTEIGFEFYQDSIQQGDIFKITVPIRNISKYAIKDSIDVLITMKDSNNKELEFHKKIGALSQNELTIVELTQPTLELSGEYIVTVEVNPKKALNECFYFNNLGIKKFNVLKDIRNPLLNVSFDGKRILDGDIISPTPYISIELEDENKYLLLNDTSAYKIEIVYPDGKTWKINFDDPRVTFLPATDNEKNIAKVIIEPDFELDGDYKLKINASDRSENKLGTNDYQVYFKIINEQMISNVFNYPNPFSTSTQFIFTLTGRELPEDFKIQIMTISGKVVREIFKDELGPLNIGLNRTEFKWDGTDEFGNPLANGVYLFRVRTTSKNGEDIKKYQTNTNQYFKNNLGKIVITR